MHVTIRDAEPGDEYGVARVHVDSWKAAYAGLIPDAVLDALSIEQRAVGWGRSIRENPGNGWRLRVAEREHSIIGWTTTSRGRDQSPGAEWGELEGIYAHPDVWGSGAGRALMDDALADLRAAGRTHAYLWVLDGNARAIAIYEHLGWALDGRSKRDTLSSGLEVVERRMTRAL